MSFRIPWESEFRATLVSDLVPPVYGIVLRNLMTSHE